MEKIYNVAHTRICTYQDALNLLETLSIQTELAMLAVNHNGVDKVSITYSYSKNPKDHLSNEIIASCVVKTKSDIYTYIEQQKKRTLEEKEKVQEFVDEPVLPKVASFFSDLLSKFDDVLTEDDPEVLKQISTKLQEAADDVSKMDLFDYERPTALMKQLLKGYKKVLNVPVDEVLVRKDKKGNLELNEAKEPDSTVHHVEKRPGVDEIKKVLSELNNIDDNTFMNKLMEKVGEFNMKLVSLLKEKEELMNYIKLLPNKEKYDISTDENGYVEIVEIPSIVMLKNVSYGPAYYSKKNGYHYYKDVEGDGIFSDIEISLKEYQLLPYKQVLCTKTKVPFERFTVTGSSNIFAVEVLDNFGLDYVSIQQALVEAKSFIKG